MVKLVAIKKSKKSRRPSFEDKDEIANKSIIHNYQETLETTENITKKRKSKKRRPSVEDKDEITNESLIDNFQETSQSAEDIRKHSENTYNKKKRKHEATIDKMQAKRDKSEISNLKSTINKEDNNEEEHKSLIKDSSENVYIDSNMVNIANEYEEKRNKDAILEKQKDLKLNRDTKRNEHYLRTWKNSRSEWKFVKKRQISVEQNVFENLSDEYWPIALEYLIDSKGASKARIIKIASDIINDIDLLHEEQILKCAKSNLLNSTKYKRARDLLQLIE